MFGRSITLFKLLGFAVRVDASWLIIALLITWSLGTGILPAAYPGLSATTYFWMGAIGALGFFGSIVLHELSHSLVARRQGLPMNGITLFIFGGVAEMGGEPQNPKVEFLMAIAGPIASIILGFVFYFVAAAGEGSWPIELVAVLSYLSWINWVLALFNLIPAFPLDGGRVLRAALWYFQGDLRRATRIASRIGQAFGILLMAFGLYQLFFGDLIAALWDFMIGMFIRGASQMSYRQLVVRDVLGAASIDRFMKRDPVTVPPGISLQTLVDDYLYRYPFQMFPVVDASDRLEGCITAGDVKQIPREEWSQHTVEDVVKPCSESNTIGPDADAYGVLSKMRETGATRLMVTDHDHLLAVITARDLLGFLASKLELEGGNSRVPHASHP